MPSDRVRFDVLADHLEVLDACAPKMGPHILTGPVHILGAEPGQLLMVRIDSITFRQNWGWIEIVGGGGAIPELESVEEVVTIPIDLATQKIALPWGAQVKAAPFFGILAVKPRTRDGVLSSVAPDYFGGNIDVRELQAGAEVFFPINCPGAGFFVGDGHAIQGDGEIVGTAVETALTGEFTFAVTENLSGIALPFALLPGRFITMAFDESIDRSVAIAIRYAIKLLTTRWGLSARDAYRHCSLFGNLSISQIVNIKKGVHFSVSTENLDM